jgi:hypothetical protein
LVAARFQAEENGDIVVSLANQLLTGSELRPVIAMSRRPRTPRVSSSRMIPTWLEKPACF